MDAGSSTGTVPGRSRKLFERNASLVAFIPFAL